MTRTTNFTDEDPSAADSWEKLSGQDKIPKPTESDTRTWEELSGQTGLCERPTELHDVTCTLGELADWMNCRDRPERASRWEYYQDKGYSFDQAVEGFVRHTKLLQERELKRSIVATYER